jgi:hypothetical protein
LPKNFSSNLKSKQRPNLPKIWPFLNKNSSIPGIHRF